MPFRNTTAKCFQPCLFWKLQASLRSRKPGGRANLRFWTKIILAASRAETHPHHHLQQPWYTDAWRRYVKDAGRCPDNLKPTVPFCYKAEGRVQRALIDADYKNWRRLCNGFQLESQQGLYHKGSSKSEKRLVLLQLWGTNIRYSWMDFNYMFSPCITLETGWSIP